MGGGAPCRTIVKQNEEKIWQKMEKKRIALLSRADVIAVKACKLLELWTRHPKDSEDSHRISGLSSQRCNSMQVILAM